MRTLRPPRPKQWKHDSSPETCAAVVRGVYADRLDKAYTDGMLGVYLRAEFDDRAADVFHMIAVALFPEEYDTPGGSLPQKIGGLVPKSGGDRVGQERLSRAMSAFAEDVLELRLPKLP